MSSSPLAVAVIGAGPAGLCAARHLCLNPQVFSILYRIRCFVPLCHPFSCHTSTFPLLIICPCCRSFFLLSQLRPTVIEQSRVIGGTWVYSPNTGDDEHGLPRSFDCCADFLSLSFIGAFSKHFSGKMSRMV